MTDDHNLKLEEKRRLIRKIAGQITDLIQHNAKNGCWLAAPKEINLQLLNNCRRRSGNVSRSAYRVTLPS